MLLIPNSNVLPFNKESWQEERTVVHRPGHLGVVRTEVWSELIQNLSAGSCWEVVATYLDQLFQQLCEVFGVDLEMKLSLVTGDILEDVVEFPPVKLNIFR